MEPAVWRRPLLPGMLLAEALGLSRSGWTGLRACNAPPRLRLNLFHSRNHRVQFATLQEGVALGIVRTALGAYGLDRERRKRVYGYLTTPEVLPALISTVEQQEGAVLALEAGEGEDVLLLPTVRGWAIQGVSYYLLHLPPLVGGILRPIGRACRLVAGSTHYRRAGLPLALRETAAEVAAHIEARAEAIH